MFRRSMILARQAFKAGQPLHETRPHLLAKGELTPGIPASEYYSRRLQLLNNLPEHSAMIVPGNKQVYASNAVFYDFRQDPNFYYLTGFTEPNSVLVLYKQHSAEDAKTIMFVPESDAKSELWEGERAGTYGAVEYFNADEAYPIKDLDAKLKTILADCRNVFADAINPEKHTPSARLVDSWIPAVAESANKYKLYSVNPLVERLRIVKSESEIDCMRAACEISSIAFNNAYKREFRSENELAAYLEYQFRINGCNKGSAYFPVVAGGDHALTIHYVRNDDVLRSGDLVLVDAGGLYAGYTADISRTWPVNGKFSEPQKQLYEAVLAVNKQCITECHAESGLSMGDLHLKSEKIMLKELSQVINGITPGNLRELYPHSIGHHVGIDVHDISSQVRFLPIAANHVVTVEPGVYVPRDSKWPKEFQGIGIRIEDNVVVGSTKDNYEVLTCDTLKEVDDVSRA